MSAALRHIAPVALGLNFAFCAVIAQAAVIYASGQRLTAAVPGAHDDIRENFIYSIDTVTGVAKEVSPQSSGLPAALGATADGRLWGYKGGALGPVDPASGVFAGGVTGGPNATAFDIAADGAPYAAPFNGAFQTQQLYRFDRATQSWSALGADSAVGDAIDAARGPGAALASPFMISLGIVGDTAYGVDLNSDSLIGLGLADGAARVIGEVGAVTDGARGAYSGFSALAGVDSNRDGAFDSLFGAVNFWDHDNDPSTPVRRLGGLIKFDLTTGGWELVGTNEGVIYFGMGSAPAPVPLPATLWMGAAALGALASLGRRRAART